MTGRLRRTRYADVVGTLALLVAMSGTAYAAHALPKNSVSSKQIKNDKVKGKDLKDGDVSAADLAAGSVGTDELQPGSVGNAQLSANSVGMAKIADGAVGSVQVSDNTLTTADLKGADHSGTISLTVPANSCGGFTLGVPGAETGDAGFLTWRTAPPNLVMGPLVFDASNHASGLVCNPSSSSVSISNAPIRVVTFRS